MILSRIKIYLINIWKFLLPAQIMLKLGQCLSLKMDISQSNIINCIWIAKKYEMKFLAFVQLSWKWIIKNVHTHTYMHLRMHKYTQNIPL